MKQGIHPTYGRVVFRDKSAGSVWVTRSTMTSNELVEADGELLPVVDVDVSSASHPFWTGRGRVLDAQGRVEQFRRRYQGATGDTARV